MDVTEQINKFKELIEELYNTQILERVYGNEKFLVINFADIMKIEPDLATDLIDKPEETIKAAEIALEQFSAETRGFKVRIAGLLESCVKSPWEINSEDIKKFVGLKGIISMASSVKHLAKSSKFECPSCGNIINVLQNTTDVFKEPERCGCGNKGKMRLIDQVVVDYIKLGVVDDLSETGNDKPIATTKIAMLESDLARKDINRMIRPGRKVIINGYLDYVREKNSNVFDSVVHVNFIEFIKVGWDTVKITDDEMDKIKELSTQPDILFRLAESQSDLQGHTEAKIATLLGLAGAPHIYDSNKQLQSRGTVHILFIGNPGSGKTYHMKRAASISPKNEFASASNASGKGLVCATIHNKDIGYVLAPGVVIKAHGGVAMIDEVDKTHPEDYGDHNNAMNDMQVKVDKADIHALLDAETCYFCTANPEDRVFTSYEPYYKQISMPKDFLDRFDLIFPIIPPKDKKEQTKIIQTVLQRHNKNGNESTWKPEFSHAFVRKYIAACRRLNPKPQLNPEKYEYIQNKLFGLMESKQRKDAEDYHNEQQMHISYRLLETIIRLSYCVARLRLKENVDEECIDVAFSLLVKSFVDMGVMNADGIIDISKLNGVDQEVIETKREISELYKELENKIGKLIPISDLIAECANHSIDEDEVYKFIDKKKNVGDWYEPRRGFISRL